MSHLRNAPIPTDEQMEKLMSLADYILKDHTFDLRPMLASIEGEETPRACLSYSYYVDAPSEHPDCPRCGDSPPSGHIHHIWWVEGEMPALMRDGAYFIYHLPNKDRVFVINRSYQHGVVYPFGIAPCFFLRDATDEDRLEPALMRVIDFETIPDDDEM